MTGLTLARAIPAPNLPDAACSGMGDQWSAWEANALHILRDSRHGSHDAWRREISALASARDAIDTCVACPEATRIACWQWARATGYDGIAGGTVFNGGRPVTGKPRRKLPDRGELDQLVALGASTAHIARRYGVSRAAVYKALRRGAA